MRRVLDLSRRGAVKGQLVVGPFCGHILVHARDEGNVVVFWREHV